MRKSCMGCTFKHLASAEIAEQEYMLGYPSHKRLVVGQLDHASTECYRLHPDLSWVIREHRLLWWDNPSTYTVPYEPLCVYVELCGHVKDGDPLPAIPEACMDGIEISDGRPQFTMDTRP